MDGMFLHLWKPILHAIYPCTMEEVSHHTNKEKRIIDTLEPVMARHKLIIDPSVIETDYKTSVQVVDKQGKAKTAYSLFYQMTRLTADKGSLIHDDRLDALAIGVAYFTERMARDADKEVKDLKAQRHEQWLKKKRAGRKSPKRINGIYNNRMKADPSLLNTNYSKNNRRFNR